MKKLVDDNLRLQNMVIDKDKEIGLMKEQRKRSSRTRKGTE